MQAKKPVSIVAVAAAIAASATPTFAHEERLLPASVNQIEIYVGHHVEPAFEDSFNAVDVILYSYDGLCSDGVTKIRASVDVNGSNGADSVNLNVDGLYLQKSVKPGGTYGSVAPTGILRQATLTNASPLFEVFNSPGVYDTAFRPTHPGYGVSPPDKPGAYAYYVHGSISVAQKTFTCPDQSVATLQPRNATINAYFVCGPNGTINATGDNFGCVTQIQPFPGTIDDGYRANRPL
jgi:hypothetical protein